MVESHVYPDKITIADILADAGFCPKGSRMACPLHGGSNPTSFSFTERGFHCFSCGASGGPRELVRLLYGSDSQQVLKRLGLLDRQRAPEDGRQPGPKPTTLERAASNSFKETIELLQIISDLQLHRLRRARQDMRAGRLPLERWYAVEQHCQMRLEHLDEEIARLKYEMNQRRSKQHGSALTRRPGGDGTGL